MPPVIPLPSITALSTLSPTASPTALSRDAFIPTVRCLQESENALPLASVIIPWVGGSSSLLQQLSALSQQEVDFPFEVIVADNGGTTFLQGAHGPLRARLPEVRVVDARAVRGAAYARNIGATAARSELLLFVDADDVVGEGWLKAMVAALEQRPFVACRMDFERLNGGAPRARRSLQQQGVQPYTYPEFLPHASGGTLGIHRSAHDAVGGFDPRLGGLEDTDYCWRVQLAGYGLSFAPDAVLHYRLRATLPGTLKQAFVYGKHNVRLYRRYRPHGMGKITLRAGLRAWYGTLRRLPDLLSAERRARLLWSLMWRVGRLYGSLRYGVFAL